MENVNENQLNDQMNNPEEGKEQPSRAKGFRNLLLYIAGVVVVVLLITRFIAIQSTITCDSMENTLSEKDSVIVDKISYRFNDPERFDIVIYPFEDTEDKDAEDIYFAKRIIGLPGETVSIDGEGVIYIDGEELEEDYGNEPIDPSRLGLADGGLTLGEDEYFVLGDNRNNSYDSRLEIVGNVRKEEIIGKVWLRLYPFKKFGFVE